MDLTCIIPKGTSCIIPKGTSCSIAKETSCIIPNGTFASYQNGTSHVSYQKGLYMYHTKGLVSSVGSALASKLRGPEFKSRAGTVGGPVTIIMWGARPGWKLAFELNLLPRVNKVTLLYFTLL